ncbi:MAG: hypothetical protein UX77_C0009G0031 [Parcubacteria group bacterium GW2011_GWA1_47_11]|nr:MAG: hypothetical protein UX77_C0009G0031 [Parcubacteria group bacterium GW2011_GWA1_47_11]
MKKVIAQHAKNAVKSTRFWFFVSLISLCGAFFSFYPGIFDSAVIYSKDGAIAPEPQETKAKEIKTVSLPPLDKDLYDRKMEELANNPPPPPPVTKIVKNPETGAEETMVVEKPAPKYLWPVKTTYPNAGALLPFNRIIAYYGNLYSTKMGALGQYPEEEMLGRLMAEVKKWEAADPTTPVVPALHYIAVVAQAGAGQDGKYRARMPSTEIDKVLVMAEKINAIVFLDIQVGFSTVQAEIPLLEKYLKMRNVHLGLDPEFSMKSGIRPGKIVGTMDATDVNFAATYLAKLVKENNLPPKVLVIHRYTQRMVTNYQSMLPLPEVQIVMHMDGWGGQAKKIGTYTHFIYPEPVQFTGFKLFYKNDTLDPGTLLFEPAQLLKLNPRPIYIQYQ